MERNCVADCTCIYATTDASLDEWRTPANRGCDRIARGSDGAARNASRPALDHTVTVHGACAGACVLTAPHIGVCVAPPASHIDADATAAGVNSGAPGECDRHHSHNNTPSIHFHTSSLWVRPLATEVNRTPSTDRCSK